MVNLSNWNYSSYVNSPYESFLSIMGGIDPSTGNYEESFMVTLQDGNKNELFQINFSDLEAAIIHMNKNYSHWNFTERSPSGGCSSCSNNG